MRYVYSLVKFVPDPFTGEFVNVGAIIGSEQTGEWQAVHVSNLKRARAIQAPGRGVAAVLDFMDRVEMLLDPWDPDGPDVEPAIHAGDTVPSEQWLRSLSDPRSVVQLTAPKPISADTIAQATNQVTQHLLIDPARAAVPFTRKTFAVKVARDDYLSVGLELNADLFERVTIESESTLETFDFAVVNGRALQLTQAFSFDLPRQAELVERLKSWAWSLSLVRRHGGSLQLEGRNVDIPRDVDIAVVYVPPSERRDGSAFETAGPVFSDLDVYSVSVADSRQIAVRAAERLGR